jgi:hypothetical protein
MVQHLQVCSRLGIWKLTTEPFALPSPIDLNSAESSLSGSEE